MNILGRKIALTPLPSGMLKGISVGDKLSYLFYEGMYREVKMLFLEPKSGNPTPRTCDLTARRLAYVLGSPIVFILRSGPTYERQRLLDRGVYFVMSEKFAHLPMLVAMESSSTKKLPTKLSPVAQYLLMYHLQVRSISGITAKELEKILPYSYSNITLGMTCLSDLGLAAKLIREDRSKVLDFGFNGRDLWTKAESFLINPVERRVYCDRLNIDGPFIECGVNALSHYSMLNPDKERIIMMTLKQYKDLSNSGAFDGLNEFDGDVQIEIWKYPALSENGFVDALSLALSLKDDEDPRVEKEVERMIDNMQWTD